MPDYNEEYVPTPSELNKIMMDEFLKNYHPTGIIKENIDEIRMSYKYQKWKQTVLSYNPNCCNKCGKSPTPLNNIILHVHHIKSFAKYPEIRFDIKNGIVLCSSCHKLEHKVRSINA